MSQPSKPAAKPADKPAPAAAASAAKPAAVDNKKEDATMKDAETGKALDSKAAAAAKPEAKEKGGKRDVKRSPNRLIVDESHGDGDNSCVMLSTAKMEGLYFCCLAVWRDLIFVGSFRVLY